MPRPALALALALLVPAGAGAQSMADGSEAAIGPESTRAVLGLLGRTLRRPEARVSALRPGRAGRVCGAVDVTNRMGAYTGPRGFVADPGADFAGRLPDDAELRHPGSAAEYRAMERARALYAESCLER